MNQNFRLHANLKNGLPSRRYHKYRYTVALRLGVVPTDRNGFCEFNFVGRQTDEVKPHGANEAFIGNLFVDNQKFDNIIFIAKARDDGRYNFITLWPSSQHPDAHESYTDPLVDTAMDGVPYDIEIVATSMHSRFQENAGVSPATLMKIIYENEAEDLRDAAKRLAGLVDEMSEIAKLEAERAQVERMKAEHAIEELALREAEIKLERERFNAEIIAARRENSVPTLSEQDLLVEVLESVMHRGSLCTILVFADGSKKHMKVETFDPDGAVTKKAKSLTGQRVRVTCWDPINSPGRWSSQGYFRNIYAVHD